MMTEQVTGHSRKSHLQGTLSVTELIKNVPVLVGLVVK